ncbi:carbohydrate binding domain-containing protein [Ferruginibacter profundus]
MKKIAANIAFTVFVWLACCGNIKVLAQTNNCHYEEPVIRIDFGTAADSKEYNLSNVKNYRKAKDGCPDDGYYSFVSYSSNCFGGRWHDMLSDHTTGDVNGKMMIVNASEKPGYFFVLKITGLKPGAAYQLSTWFANICRYSTGCYPTPPVIAIGIFANDKMLSGFETGQILQTSGPLWQKYTGEFTMPLTADAVTIQMKDMTTGGCGNDFAMDDIFISECILPQPEVKQKENSPPVITVTKPVEKVIPPPVKTETNRQPQKPAEQIPANKTTVVPAVVQKKIMAPVPEVIETRANPVVRQIKTEATELTIELYDNGEIDGDTVSIYHNNELVVNHAGISAKPVSLKIKVDKQQPHHELIMVADNLGNIPPNTSLMIITAGKKRYEIFISSSEQKNAKVVIDLQE